MVNVTWRDNGIESRRLEAKDLWLLSFRTEGRVRNEVEIFFKVGNNKVV